MQKMPNPRRKYASLHHPSIQAVAHKMFRFSTEEEALEQLNVMAKNFISSKQQLTEGKVPSLHLWIRGYEVSADEKARGYLGHFALISCKKIEGRYCLYATKLETNLTIHPQRAQIKRDNPNWGHPVLRSARKGKFYDSLEDAQAELDLLHKQYPTVSIPNPAKLYIMIYCSKKPANNRMVKHVVEIKANDAGKYYLEVKENTYKPSAKPKRIITVPGAAQEEPVGSFTARVALRRKRKPGSSNTAN